MGIASKAAAAAANRSATFHSWPNETVEPLTGSGSGARGGEKLHEQLFNSYERSRPTVAEKILLAEREPLAVETVEAMFCQAARDDEHGSPLWITRDCRRAAPDFQSPPEAPVRLDLSHSQ